MATPLSRFANTRDAIDVAIQSQSDLLDPTLPFATVKNIHENGNVAGAKGMARAGCVMAASAHTADAKHLQAMAAQILMLLSWQASTMEKIIAFVGAAVRTMTAAEEGSPCHHELSRGLTLVHQMMEQQVNFLGLTHSGRRKVL